MRARHRGELVACPALDRKTYDDIRETAQRSLDEIKAFWKDCRVWPETETIDLYRSAVVETDELIYMDQDGHSNETREHLESAYLGRYEEHGAMAFTSEHAKKRWEYYEGLTPAE